MENNYSRPFYENQDTLKKELAFASYIEDVSHVSLKKLPVSHKVDCLVHDWEGAVIGVAELKCRELLSTSIKTYMIAAMKYKEGASWTSIFTHTSANKEIPLCFFLFVRFKDMDMFYKYNKEHQSQILLEYGGRTRRRRDVADVEAVAHIPMKLFQPITQLGGIL